MRRASIGVVLAAAASIAGCAAPRHAIPSASRIDVRLPKGGPFDQDVHGRMAYGRLAQPEGRAEEVLLVPIARQVDALVRRSGLLTEGSRIEDPAPLSFTEARLSIRVLTSSKALREPTIPELARVAAALDPSFPLSAGARRWLDARVPAAGFAGEASAQLSARRAEGEPSLLDALVALYRAEQGPAQSDERRMRRDSRLIGGLVGWEQGAYSGYSWSVPLHLERHDERTDRRDLFLFPLLSGGTADEDGSTVVLGPLLSYVQRREGPTERSSGALVLGAGRLTWESVDEGRTELDLWPAATAIVHRTDDQTLGISPPLLGFYLRQGDEARGRKRWAVLPPVLAASYRFEDPGDADGVAHDRGFFFALGPLVLGDHDKLGERERSRLLMVPLLGYRQTRHGENVPEGTVVVRPREESSTHLLGSLVHWESARPGLYRPEGIEDAAPHAIGEDHDAWWFLPLVSYDREGEDSELMLWPLLGLGFGKEDGERYVRLFYFLKL